MVVIVSSVADRPLPKPTVIEPPRRFVPLALPELWAYRDLFGFLVWRDIKLRSAQTRIGGAWLVLQPLALLAVYTFAFSRIVKTHLDVPYPLFALVGLTAWWFISRGLSQGSESLVSQLNVIKRTACPRILFPLGAVTSCGIDFLISIALYFILGALYGRTPSWHAIFVLPLLLVAFALAFGLALLLAPTHARYRDVGRLLPFLIQLWFFMSPVAYALPRVGAASQIVEVVNPIVGIASGFRWALLGTPVELKELLLAIAMSMVVLALGIVHFNRAQQTIADDL